MRLILGEFGKSVLEAGSCYRQWTVLLPGDTDGSRSRLEGINTRCRLQSAAQNHAARQGREP